MASPITLEAFKRGDTPTFRFEFSSPTVGFDWSGVIIDVVMTSVLAPNDNSGAAVTRIAQTLSLAGTTAYYECTLTINESIVLVPGTTYKIEAQLKQNGVSVVTPITAQVKVLQDYVI